MHTSIGSAESVPPAGRLDRRPQGREAAVLGVASIALLPLACWGPGHLVNRAGGDGGAAGVSATRSGTEVAGWSSVAGAVHTGASNAGLIGGAPVTDDPGGQAGQHGGTDERGGAGPVAGGGTAPTGGAGQAGGSPTAGGTHAGAAGHGGSLGSVEVSGTVRDSFGTLRPGIGVRIGEAFTVSDEAGRFTLTAPGTPFDLQLSYVAGPPNTMLPTAIAFIGVTRTTPDVWLPHSFAQIRVHLRWGITGDAIPLEGDELLVFSVGLAGRAAHPLTLDADFSGSSAGLLSEETTDPAHMRMQAVLVARADGHPTSYGGVWDWPDLEFENMGPLEWTENENVGPLELTRHSVPTRSVQLNFEFDSGALEASNLQLRCVLRKDGGVLKLFEDDQPESGEYLFPADSYGSVSCSFESAVDTAHTVWFQRSNIGPAAVEFRLTPPPVLLWPQAGATVAPGQEFSWSDEHPGTFQFIGIQGQTTVIVVTTGESLVMPDFARDGIDLAGENATWRVRRIPLGSVDEALKDLAASYQRDYETSQWEPVYLERDGCYSTSETRVMTLP